MQKCRCGRAMLRMVYGFWCPKCFRILHTSGGEKNWYVKEIKKEGA